jgi:hypothetical protein
MVKATFIAYLFIIFFSSISDCIIFVFLGIALFKKGMFEPKNWHIGFIMWTLVLCLFYRFVGRYKLNTFCLQFVEK